MLPQRSLSHETNFMLMEVRLCASQTQKQNNIILESVCYITRGTKSTTVVMQKHNLVLNIKKEGVIHVHKGDVRVNIFSV